VIVAVPEAMLAVPSVALPFRKVTVPEGNEVPEDGDTFAVNTDGLPRLDAVGLTESVVVVAISSAAVTAAV
jgi:hypothetical protein